MTDRIDRAIESARQAGVPVALAVIVGGAEDGSRLLVWRGGEALGNLGSPRLNQRVALYAEGLLVRGGVERKQFDVPGGDLEIETTVYGVGDSGS